VPDAVQAAFAKLPPVMARADSRAGQIDHAVIDLAEAVLLDGRQGEQFAATVIDADDRGGHVQLRDHPVVVRIDGAGLVPGNAVTIRLDAVDVGKRTTHFVISGTETG
jgi:exoribonuclease R